MIQQETLITFIITSIVVCLIPGPAILFVISKTMKKGLRSGFNAVWGLQFGFVLQVIAAVCGVSAVIVKSSFLFTILKYVGAIYLIYLGATLLLQNETDETHNKSFLLKERSPFFEGILINLLNPKIAIFFISYIPQFINPNGVSPLKQLLVLGFVFCTIGTITTIGYAVSSRFISEKWSNPKFGAIFKKWIPGAIFLGFGVKLATIEK